jgi:protein-S-isoprenylcysteine O-methyltransferase Ste14
MAALHSNSPLFRWLDWPWRWLGLVPVLLSGVVAVTARSQFHRRGTTIKPFRPPTVLVTGGVFRVSRNPMYLALVLILLGIGIFLGTASPLIVLPLFVWLLTVNVIRREERSLAAQFGDAYARYKREVRRWI